MITELGAIVGKIVNRAEFCNNGKVSKGQSSRLNFQRTTSGQCQKAMIE